MVFKYVGDAEDTLYLLRRTLDKPWNKLKKDVCWKQLIWSAVVI